MINPVLSGKTRIIVLFTLLLMVNMVLIAQVPEWLWATQAGGSSDEKGYGITTDANGNNYVIGIFNGTATFGSYSITSAGDYDIFVAKMDANCNWLWATRAGGSEWDECSGITIDDAGNSYVTGWFQETSTFGSYSLTSSGGSDIFVAKIDANGNWLWITQAGGTSYDDGYEMIIDDTGIIYVTGSFYETAIFGSYSLTSSGGSDIFVAKMDANGNWLWVTQAGGTDGDRGIGITIDDTGNSYVTGCFKGTATFGSFTQTSSGVDDIFVAKMDATGNWLWATKAGGSSFDRGNGITIDNAGNIYVAGFFYETATFGSYSLTSSGEKDIFVAKMDANGNWQWASKAGGIDGDEGKGITIDDAGSSYVTGGFSETVTFGSHSLTSSGSGDIFIAKMETSGNWIWASKAGGTYNDYGDAITIDDTGNSYVTGYFRETATFGSYSLYSSGSGDIFVAKLNSSVFAENGIISTINSLSNYPNPFNPETTIEFSIEQNQQNEQIELEIYNLKGQKIKTIPVILSGVEGSVIWNGTDNSGQPVSSGLYLYKLKVNGKTEAVRKCLLLK